MVTSRELSLKRKNNELIETLLSVQRHLHSNLFTTATVLDMARSEDMGQVVKIEPTLKGMMDDDRTWIAEVTKKLKEVL